eukprot:CAMPEP_0203813220 /NCGR_PEP_ID=MMETSP0115-20131106/4595_1 /ASSEMBLY_ACC=CAM_ASM_000227 /TAXON_ID=33651 /ORGANISM="Bicosoecid sp, Strain ms1" /LENGTH=332 /DNA_ID=CAMNT_0050722083 /DNA_START=9 /DNA_END=1003 /DNA_ORIENTATION=-
MARYALLAIALAVWLAPAAASCYSYVTCTGCTEAPEGCDYCVSEGCQYMTDSCSGTYYRYDTQCPSHYYYDDDDTGVVGGSITGSIIGFIILVLLIRWCIVGSRSSSYVVVSNGRRRPGRTVVKQVVTAPPPGSYAAQPQYAPPAPYSGGPGGGYAPPPGPAYGQTAPPAPAYGNPAYGNTAGGGVPLMLPSDDQARRPRDLLAARRVAATARRKPCCRRTVPSFHFLVRGCRHDVIAAAPPIASFSRIAAVVGNGVPARIVVDAGDVALALASSERLLARRRVRVHGQRGGDVHGVDAVFCDAAFMHGHGRLVLVAAAGPARSARAARAAR